MEGYTFAESPDRAVFRIAIDGVAAMSELDAQLMAATSLRPDFEPGQTTVGPQTCEVQECLLGTGSARLDDFDPSSAIVFLEPIVETTSSLVECPFDNGPIDFFDGPFAKLLAESCCGFARAGKEENAGNRSVEPMDDAEINATGFVILGPQVFSGLDVERQASPLEMSTGHTGRLCDGQAMIVLVQHLQLRVGHVRTVREFCFARLIVIAA